VRRVDYAVVEARTGPAGGGRGLPIGRSRTWEGRSRRGVAVMGARSGPAAAHVDRQISQPQPTLPLLTALPPVRPRFAVGSTVRAWTVPVSTFR
jgi:hypothetical protein